MTKLWTVLSRTLTILWIIGLMFLLWGFPHPAWSADVSIRWKPPVPSNEVAGYAVLWGAESRTYTDEQAVPGAGNTNATVDLSPSQTWYLALAATNRWGARSGYSKEMVWDNEPPVLIVPESIEVDLPAGQPVRMPDYTSLVSATDDFSAAAEIVIRQTPAGGEPIPPDGLVTFEAEDMDGNIGRVQRVVKVTIKAVPAVSGVSGSGGGKELQINKGAQ